MADLATAEFLSSLKAARPLNAPNSPPYLWAQVAAVSFSASNAPEAVPLVFQYALGDLVQSQTAAGTPEDTAREEQLILARKIREAVFQSGLLSGIARAMDSLIALHKVMPEHLRETDTLRDTRKPPAEWDKRGTELFDTIYRESGPSVQGLLNTAYPDICWFCMTIGYGMAYSGTDVLSVLEVIYLMVATTIAIDAPRQLGWHLANARRAGAELSEVRAVRQIALDVARRAGARWRSAVPDVEA